MNAEDAVGLVLALAAVVYLVVALVRSDRVR
ncbi:potassium-transporting ATPase subunit F [Serinicoccus sediminis]|nr:potassium-transporting ATPase subunit F [Serinicoccus sediminis]